MAILIDERDEILENLEIAETKYINSFKLTTPDPSIVDFLTTRQNEGPGAGAGAATKPQISRPRPLAKSSVSMLGSDKHKYMHLNLVLTVSETASR